MERKEQQENERITGDIFNPFNWTPSITENLLHRTPNMTTERYVCKTRPLYSHTRKITVQQIHKVDDEYDIITNQQKLGQEDIKLLFEIDKQTDIWTKQDTHGINTAHGTYNHQQQQQKQKQQHT